MKMFVNLICDGILFGIALQAVFNAFTLFVGL